jgi:hypothetical protein
VEHRRRRGTGALFLTEQRYEGNRRQIEKRCGVLQKQRLDILSSSACPLTHAASYSSSYVNKAQTKTKHASFSYFYIPFPPPSPSLRYNRL